MHPTLVKVIEALQSAQDANIRIEITPFEGYLILAALDALHKPMDIIPDYDDVKDKPFSPWLLTDEED